MNDTVEYLIYLVAGFGAWAYMGSVLGTNIQLPF